MVSDIVQYRERYCDLKECRYMNMPSFWMSWLRKDKLGMCIQKKEKNYTRSGMRLIAVKWMFLDLTIEFTAVVLKISSFLQFAE
jgi:hypothetical protein